MVFLVPNLQNVLGGLGGNGGGRFTPTRGLVTKKPTGASFPKTLTHADFNTSDVACTASTWNELGSYTVGAQQFATYGQGATGNPSEQVGRTAIDIENTSGSDYDGLIRLFLENAQGTQSTMCMEERTEKLSENLTDMTKWVTAPEFNVWAGEDSKLTCKFYPSSADSVDYGESSFYIPITIYQ